MKILFLYNHPYPDYWKDGLFAALKLVGEKHDLTWCNIAKEKLLYEMKHFQEYDFILGWGGFQSPVDSALQLLKQLPQVKARFGLCLAGNAFPLKKQRYDVLFYETEWTKNWLLNTTEATVPPLVHAFGYNSDVYFDNDSSMLPIQHQALDYLTIGAFAMWKRQEKLLTKKGLRLAVGEIQEDNLPESMAIIGPLIMGGVLVGNMVLPEELCRLYRLARTVYIPADEYGGGERAILEAKACGANVEVEPDNAKLQELVAADTSYWNQIYYRDQLLKGIIDLSKV